MYKVAMSIMLFVSTVLGGEVIYRDRPLSIAVSGTAMNVVEFPDKVEKVQSSNPYVQIKINGNKVVVKTPQQGSVDLYVVTKNGRDYLLYLMPENRPPDIVRIVDTRKKERKEAASFERRNEYENLIASLISSVLRGTAPPGYERRVKTFTIETPYALFVFLEEFDGWDYRVVRARVFNRLEKRLRIREDMDFVRKILRKVYSDVYGVAITKEFLAPVSAGPDTSSALLVAVVPNREARSSKVSEMDRIIKKFLKDER